MTLREPGLPDDGPIDLAARRLDSQLRRTLAGLRARAEAMRSLDLTPTSTCPFCCRPVKLHAIGDLERCASRKEQP